MNNADDSASDQEQLATVPMDYRALLAMTRPFVITEDTPLSFRAEKISLSDLGISPEPADWRAEFILRAGEFLCLGGEWGVAWESTSALGQTGSNLILTIYLGMS
jgi:hypothetical protein